MIERRKETRIVKQAMKDAGYTGIRVRHGTGTAWGWIDVHADRDETRKYSDQRNQLIQVVQEATGRHGDYHGNIGIYLDE